MARSSASVGSGDPSSRSLAGHTATSSERYIDLWHAFNGQLLESQRLSRLPLEEEDVSKGKRGFPSPFELHQNLNGRLSQAFVDTCHVLDELPHLPVLPHDLGRVINSYLQDHCLVMSASSGIGAPLLRTVARLIPFSSVRELYLSSGSCGDDEVVLLAEALTHRDCRVQTLDLEDCSFADKGSWALVRALEKNATLRSLNLLGNTVSVKCVIALLRVLLTGQNTTLSRLQLPTGWEDAEADFDIPGAYRAPRRRAVAPEVVRVVTALVDPRCGLWTPLTVRVGARVWRRL